MKPTPPKIVKAPEGCAECLTPGKEYSVLKNDGSLSPTLGFGLWIVNDYGEKIFTNEKESFAYLNGQNWIIVEREKES